MIDKSNASPRRAFTISKTQYNIKKENVFISFLFLKARRLAVLCVLLSLRSTGGSPSIESDVLIEMLATPIQIIASSPYYAPEVLLWPFIVAAHTPHIS